MARAFPQSLAHDGGRDQSGADWQSLRGELVALLDQVESQVARSRDDGKYDVSERMRDLGMRMAEPMPEPPATRHREALRSVQRAVDRFSYREEPSQANARDSLQSAIDQIRGRQGAVPARVAEVPRLDEFATAMGGMTARLERIESALKSGIKSGGDVKMVADQVSQLANVVELLAGAVGETGQVKRLEGQIASLGKIIAQSREADTAGMTRRLDDMSTAMGRLADLQVQFANKVESPVQSAAFKDGMQGIESSVRNVYDRIDSLERNGGATPAAIEHLTDEMARFTEAMRSTASPQNLIDLVDALNTRISDLESGDRLLHGLRKDLGSLRDAVTVSLEPRFDSLERQIEALSPAAADFSQITQHLETLSARIAERPIDNGIGQIEAQVRQLVARMDQTGEQLSGLAKLYGGNEPASLPDFDALAEMVATRTSAAVAEAGPASGLDQASLDGLEQRITAMLRTMKPEVGSDQFGGMQRGIEEVNERLQRLETSLLARQAAHGDHSVAFAPEPEPPYAYEAAATDIASLIEADDVQFTDQPVAAPLDVPPLAKQVHAVDDAMPGRPDDDDVPVNAPAFPEPVVDSRGNQRRLHPGLEEEFTLAARYDDVAEAKGPAFDPASVTLPPAPTPSLGLFEPQPKSSEPMPEPSPVAVSSRNTFIEAARRAAQRQGPSKAAPASNSLIGRALARFNKPDADEAPHRTPAGDKPVPKEWQPEPVIAPVASVHLAEPTMTGDDPAEHDDELADDTAPAESFLLRNRKVILLGAAVVALAFLTYNLMMQRAASDRAAAPTETALTTGSIDQDSMPLGAEPASGMAVDFTAPRVIPMAETFKTGSIDAAASQGFAAAAQPMPGAIGAASELGAGDTAPIQPLSGDLVSPVKFELPPEGVGPLDLREAAAGGDARAQFEVAAIYTEGRAVPQDFKAAGIWYERAAAQGFAPAQYRLGTLYENGEGVTKDLAAAKLWYERAAETGNRMSMHNLAALYAGGDLGKQQFDSAAKWFEEAASRGLTDSQFNLGMLYARGLGVTQSLEDSFKWFGIAALSGDKDAAKARDDMARSLSAETVSRLTAEIQAFKPLSIDLSANFAPIGTWSKNFDPGEVIGAREIVASVQVALGKLGFDIGTPDGVTGPKTSDAIKAFERATGMTETGQINPRLLAVLGSQPV